MNTYGTATSRGRKIHGEDVAKGMTKQGTKPVLARVTPAAGGGALKATKVTKGFGEAVTTGLKAFKEPKALASGIKDGFGAARAGSTRIASPVGVGARVGNTIGAAAGANPVKTGAVLGGATVGGAALMNKDRQNMYAPQPPLISPRSFGKRSYDPEADRRYRQGAAAAGTGIAGLGALTYAGRETRDATRVARRGAAFAPHAGRLQVIELENGAGNKIKAKLVSQRAIHVADRLKRGGVATSRSGALAGAAGLGLLGAAGALSRNRHEERWD